MSFDGRKKAKSPYKRYGKRPHVYSQLFREWLAAVRAGDNSAAEALGRRHSAVYLARGSS